MTITGKVRKVEMREETVKLLGLDRQRRMNSGVGRVLYLHDI